MEKQRTFYQCGDKFITGKNCSYACRKEYENYETNKHWRMICRLDSMKRLHAQMSSLARRQKQAELQQSSESITDQPPHSQCAREEQVLPKFDLVEEKSAMAVAPIQV